MLENESLTWTNDKLRRSCLVIAKLKGGLGNQMFQYAAARRLAYTLNAELKLDLSWFNQYQERLYGLQGFRTIDTVASKEETQLLMIGKPVLLRKILRRYFGLQTQHPKSYVQEKSPAFDSTILSLPDGVYLEGFWQSEKYFIDTEATVRKEFSLRTPPSSRSLELAQQIESSNSVSIHIRRGDYLAPDKIEYHGVCSLDYYVGAVNIISRRIPFPHFFVFSDDHEWAVKNLPLSYPTTFVHEADNDKPYEDIWAMSLCSHHIIANSSFSWWGAWLSTNPDKIVITPKQWFRLPTLDAGEIVPERWIRI